ISRAAPPRLSLFPYTTLFRSRALQRLTQPAKMPVKRLFGNARHPAQIASAGISFQLFGAREDGVEDFFFRHGMSSLGKRKAARFERRWCWTESAKLPELPRLPQLSIEVPGS